MFAYQDPSGRGVLASQNALDIYRTTVDRLYRRSALQLNSAFTLLEAFEGLTFDRGLSITTLPWIAFPRLANQPFNVIDADRFNLQDEYVEWRTEFEGEQVARITFTTEFPEYYQALAQVSTEALIAGIQDAIPRANPTVEELFGSNFNPDLASPLARANRFRDNLRQNPWNNGEKGILCLTQRNNTMGALFGLVEPCAIARRDIPASAVCGMVACVPGRNSDPIICQASQNLARNLNGLSLQDPVGIQIKRLVGTWKIDGQEIGDINDPDRNQGAWVISRNGRRAVLEVSKGVTIGDTVITSGAQVAAQLQVGADVISAPESVLPDWAKTGEESSRLIRQI